MYDTACNAIGESNYNMKMRQLYRRAASSEIQRRELSKKKKKGGNLSLREDRRGEISQGIWSWRERTQERLGVVKE